MMKNLNILTLKLMLSMATANQLLPSKFILDMAINVDVKTIIFYLPGKQPTLTEQLKTLSENSDLPIVYKYHGQNKTLYSETSGRILCFFLVDPKNKHESLKHFKHIFNPEQNRNEVIWLLDTGSHQDLDEVKGFLSETTLDLDDDLYLFNRSGSGTTILEAYRVSTAMPVAILDLGSWNESTGLKITDKSKWIRRKDLQGLELRTQSLVSHPFISELIPKKDGFFTGEGLFFDILDDLKKTLNFTYTVRKPPDNKWGSRNANGSWNGMIDQLMKNQTDIAVADLLTTFSRSQVASFGISLLESYYGMLIKNTSGRFNWLAYLEPLHFMAWLSVFVICATLPPVLWWSTVQPRKDIAHEEFTLGKSYIFLLSFLTKRGWSKEPSGLASRICFISLALGTFLLYQHWEAMLISVLSVRITALPFKNFPELMSKSNYKVIISPGTAVEDYFRRSKDPILQEVWTERIKPNYKNYKTKYAITEHLAKDSSLATMAFFPAISYTQEYLNCDIVSIPGAKILSIPASIAFQKDSPYVELFNFYLKQMSEQGTLEKLLGSAKKERECPSQNGKPIGFNGCLTAFLALTFGFLSGLLLMCLEKLYKPSEKTRIFDNSTWRKQELEGLSDLLGKIGPLIQRENSIFLNPVKHEIEKLEEFLDNRNVKRL